MSAVGTYQRRARTWWTRNGRAYVGRSPRFRLFGFSRGRTHIEVRLFGFHAGVFYR